MKFLVFISLVAAIIVFSCEKQIDDAYTTIQEEKQGLERKEPSSLNLISDSLYCKDSVREAFLLRAKGVLAKYAGYELIKSNINQLSVGNDTSINKIAPYIYKIRNVKDTLFVEIRFYSESVSDMLTGIDIVSENSLNFLCENYNTINEKLACLYSVKYTILKRKSSRLKLSFRGKPLYNY